MVTAQPRSQAPAWPLALAGLALIGILAFMAGPALGGDLAGSDDMMRMQQVRDLMSGQGWFDVSQKRLLTPEGGAMHWSRLPDIVLAGMVLLMQPLIGREMAEGLAVTIWPLAQLGWALAALATCLRRLNASLAGQIAGLVFLCSSFALASYLPGRIDHHGLGLALTLTGLACLLSPDRTARSAILAACCVAAMITVAIENLPAVGLIIAGFGSAWILRGEVETNRLRFFGASLVIASLIAYVFDAPGAGGDRAVCDAYGQSHFVALLVAGAGLFCIATFMPRTEKWSMRTVAMAIAGGATALSFIAVNPECLGNPYSGLSGEVQTGWLSVVSEARSLPAVFDGNVGQGLYFYGFAFAGLVAAAYAFSQSPEGQKFPRGAFLVAMAAAFCIEAWQLRGATLAHALAAIAGGWAFGELFDSWRKSRTARSALLLFAGFLVISPMGWHLPSIIGTRAAEADTHPEADCKSSDAYQLIAAAPRMIVFTPIDLGAPLIFHTKHYATAAPYHRNASSIEMTLSVFGGSADTARRKMELTGATHLLYCPGISEIETYASRSPEGFAAQLEAGDIPRWLTPLASEEGRDGPIIYTIAYDRN